jgi:DNA invertase Pin-like site-specific DNA recombinase
MSSDDGIITLGDAIIYLRMSDFRDEDVRTFGERERQLRDFAAGLGVPAGRVRVAIENDAGNGGYRHASAYKRPVRVTTATGLVTMRTRRPVFARVLLDLQTGKAGVLICDDVSRIARDERDALDLIDAESWAGVRVLRARIRRTVGPADRPGRHPRGDGSPARRQPGTTTAPISPTRRSAAAK